jgi:hypothetical protein
VAFPAVLEPDAMIAAIEDERAMRAHERRIQAATDESDARAAAARKAEAAILSASMSTAAASATSAAGGTGGASCSGGPRLLEATLHVSRRGRVVLHLVPPLQAFLTLQQMELH